MKTCLMFFALAALAATAAEPVPAALFGQNLEHTRASITGGLSAELVRNRKFAGKPSPEGVAFGWEAFGTRAAYDLLLSRGYTRHLDGRSMPRRNEISSQKITTLTDDGCAGIVQRALCLRADADYRFTARVRGEFEEDAVKWIARLRTADGRVAVERRFVSEGKAWSAFTFDFPSAGDDDVALELGVEGRASGVVGTVSLMPKDSFNGMRRDVIDCLKAIGTSIVRWPGGNFAGDYRWRDGQLPRDERAPLQSYLESETQAYTGGFDVNDIGTEEVLSLCRELGAEPYFTINAAWDKPEDSADWVRFCKGRVNHWSLGNEFGYPHMEGPKTPEEYARLARSHAEAMLKADPSLSFCTSGHYPDHFEPWLEGSGIPLSGLAREISTHCYSMPRKLDFSTPARTSAAYAEILEVADGRFAKMREMRAKMPEGMRISFDEWNFWYAWFREDGAIQGIYTMHFLHRLMRDWKELGISCACHFQAVNEGAIRVSPRSVRLTSIGEALRLAKGHVGGVPLGGLPREAFGTDFKDGSRRYTLYNPSADTPLRMSLPVGRGRNPVETEILGTDDPYPGSRYHRIDVRILREGDAFVLELPPRAIGSLLFAKWG